MLTTTPTVDAARAAEDRAWENADHRGLLTAAFASTSTVGQAVCVLTGPEFSVVMDTEVSLGTSARYTHVRSVVLSDGHVWCCTSAWFHDAGERWSTQPAQRRADVAASSIRNASVWGVGRVGLLHALADTVQNLLRGPSIEPYKVAFRHLVETCPEQEREEVDATVFLLALTRPTITT